MTFYEVVNQIIDLLQRQKRVSYRAIKREFGLDDAFLEDIKEEIIEAQQLARDENGKVLVWTGNTDMPHETAPVSSAPQSVPPASVHQEREPLVYTPQHLADKILTSRSALEGERKQVTVLFCDLAHSTAIAEQIGPEPMHSLLSRFFELALNEVHRFEGTVNQFLGDGFMALFGAPIAHEDHARRGVLAAYALQQTLKETNLGSAHGVACAFRMGLNSGPVVVGSIGDNLRMDYSAIGDTTNLAARLQPLAEPGSILISASTARLVEDTVHLEPLQPVQVKGKAEPITPYQVLGARPRRSPIVSRSERTLSQFVGRERELAHLEELFAQVEAGQGQVVGIVGEAGQGKSRLLHEFRQRLQDKPVTYLEGRCLSYGSTIPYHPLIDMMRNHCGIGETESPEAIQEKIRDSLQEVGMPPADSAPYLLHLLGVQEGTASMAQLTPEALRTRTFETLRQMSLQGSRQRPLIMETEDLHWCDQTSEDFLASLVESLAGASIMLLTTYRSGYRPPWIAKSYATQLSLRSLVSHDAFTLVRSHSQHTAMPARVAQTLVQKAEGNPFFLEELTRTVLDHGDFLAETTVPDTIQGVLSARIDRLPETHKRLLQTASVLGRGFSPTVLKALWDETEAIEPLLVELKRLEFLFERTGAEEPLYVFKHALTQDVAYEMLLLTRRQALHAAAGHALEKLYHHWLAKHYEALAHHFTLGTVWEKACDYLTKSGDKARQAYANQEAIVFYTRAIEVSGRMPPLLDETHLLSVYEGRGLVWFLLSKYDEAITDFEMMGRIAHVSGNQHKVGESLCHLAFTHQLKHSEEHISVAQQYAWEALQLAQPLGDQDILARSLGRLGSLDLLRGDLAAGERKLEESVQISRREGYKDTQNLVALSALAYWQGHCQRAVSLAQEGVTVARAIHDDLNELRILAFLCLEYWGTGQYAQALTVLHAGFIKAQERQNTFIRGKLTNTLGWFHREFGDLAHAVAHDHESMEFGRTSGISNVEISALINLGLDYLALGQSARAFSSLAPTLDRVEREAFGAHRWRWRWTIKLLLGLAELSYTTGDHDQALRYVEAGLQEAQRTSSQKYVALGWALRGKIIRKLGDADAAGTELQRACTLAEHLQSPSLLYPIALYL